jgi:hypothetical protein
MKSLLFGRTFDYYFFPIDYGLWSYESGILGRDRFYERRSREHVLLTLVGHSSFVYFCNQFYNDSGAGRE